MEQYCILCDRYVELRHDREAWTLRHVSTDEEGYVCDQCINKKLNFGEPLRNCLYCQNDPDYILQRNHVSLSRDGPMISRRHPNKPIICEDHFQQLEEKEKDHTLDIEDALTSEDQLTSPDVPIPEAIGRQEDQHLEYKETFQYNPHTGEQDKSLKSKIVKEVAAFGNSEGGVIVIGVDDENHDVKGLEHDYNSMDKGRDGFELEVSDVLNNEVGPTFTAQYTTIEFEEVDGDDICVIRVDPSPNPLIINKDQFYIRQGNSSRPLNKEETIEYISDHWET